MKTENKKGRKEPPAITITYSSSNEMQFAECLDGMIRNHLEGTACIYKPEVYQGVSKDKGDIWTD